MKTVTRMLEEELYESFDAHGHKVMIDMRQVQQKKGQSPPDLLLSALAGCSAVDIVVMLKKRKKHIIDFTIETDGTRQEHVPRFFTAIHCHFIITSPDVNEEEFHKAAQLSLEKYCTVASSLKAVITFSIAIKKTDV